MTGIEGQKEQVEQKVGQEAVNSIKDNKDDINKVAKENTDKNEQIVNKIYEQRDKAINMLTDNDKSNDIDAKALLTDKDISTVRSEKEVAYVTGVMGKNIRGTNEILGTRTGKLQTMIDNGESPDIFIKEAISFSDYVGVKNKSIFDDTITSSLNDLKGKEKTFGGQENLDSFINGVRTAQRKKIGELKSYLSDLVGSNGNFEKITQHQDAIALGLNSAQEVSEFNKNLNTVKQYLGLLEEHVFGINTNENHDKYINAPKPNEETINALSYMIGKSGPNYSRNLDAIMKIGGNFAGNEKILIFDVKPEENDIPIDLPVEPLGDNFSPNKADMSRDDLPSSFIVGLKQQKPGTRLGCTLTGGVDGDTTFSGWSDSQISEERNKFAQLAPGLGISTDDFSKVESNMMQSEGGQELQKQGEEGMKKIRNHAKLAIMRMISAGNIIKQEGAANKVDIKFKINFDDCTIGKKSADGEQKKKDRFTNGNLYKFK